MSVAFFTRNLEVGGAQRVLVNVTAEFAKRDQNVEIVLQKKQGALLEHVHDDVSIVDLNADPFIPIVQALREYLKKRRPDVLVSTVNTANLAAIMAVKTTRTGTRHVVRIANTLSKIAQGYDKRLTDRPFPYLMRLLYPQADQLVAVSGGIANDLVKNYGIDRNKIEVIYNPTVTDALIEQSNEPVDHAWLNNSEIDVILGVGSLTKQKDFSTLIRAFYRVQKKRGAKLMILGKGKQREQLETLTQKLGIEDSVALPGQVSNPYAYMTQADVFVLSSRWEGCPNVLIEALACGCPVVATDCPHGPSEILEDGKYGPLVPVGDQQTLANAIVDTIESPRDTAMLKDRGSDFYVQSITDEYERLL